MLILIILANIAMCILFWWVDKYQRDCEDREDKEFAEQIKHLPIERQAELWATHLRIRSEQM
jgi:hypothetical protein